MRKFLFAALILASTTVANAALIGSPTVANPVVAGAPAGHTVNDILIDFDGQLFGQQMVLTLSSGAIYQDAFGSNTAPNPALIPVFPALAADSFVTIGGTTSASSQSTLVVGGSTELGMNAALKFDTAGINIAWAPSPGVVVNGGTDYLIARITLSNTANGDVFLFSNASGQGTVVPAGTVTNGVIAFEPRIPEPTTCVLAGLALVGAAARRRV